jgi:hypothetical protein
LRQISIAAVLTLVLLSFGDAKPPSKPADQQFGLQESGLALISDAKTGTILVDAKVDSHPIVMILDTGASRTMFDGKYFGVSPVDLQAARMNKRGVGIDADVVWRRADFSFADQKWSQQEVQVADLRWLSKIYGRQIDGIIGQDVLRQFASVQINYKWHCVMLQK